MHNLSVKSRGTAECNNTDGVILHRDIQRNTKKKSSVEFCFYIFELIEIIKINRKHSFATKYLNLMGSNCSLLVVINQRQIVGMYVYTYSIYTTVISVYVVCMRLS